MRNVLVALNVLEAVAYRQPIGVGEIARALTLPKSNVQRALLTLAEGGWIRSTHGELTRWMLTTKSLVVGMQAAGLEGVRDAALPTMHRLRAEVNETTNLTLFEGKFAVLLERLDSTHPVRTFAQLGVQAPLHASAAGRAILSRLPPETVDEILSEPLPRYTPLTLTDRSAVLEQVRLTRERGYGLTVSEWKIGVVAVAAAIVRSTELDGRMGRVVGCIGISGPEHRMPLERLHQLGPMLTEAAEDIVRAIEGRRA